MLIGPEYANRVLKEFLAENGQELLIFKIIEVCQKHAKTDESNSLSKKDLVFAGLRYPEFLTDSSDDRVLLIASEFANALRAKYGIDFNTLRDRMAYMGWH
jgi:hypothetical protein